MKTITAPLMAATLALALAACNQKTEKAVDSAANTTDQAAADIGNGIDNIASRIGNAASNAVDTLSPAPTGQEFADKAAKSDAFEIAAARLALKNSQSADVKSFARAMIAGHTESTAKIKAAAGKAATPITPDATLTSDQQDKLTNLGNLTGTDFDKQYVSGQVDAHEDALSLMEDYAGQGDIPSLKAAAKAIAPVVQKHLDMAKALKG